MAWQSLQQIVVNKKSSREISLKIYRSKSFASASQPRLASMFSFSFIHSIYFRPQNCEIWFSHLKSLLLPLLTQYDSFSVFFSPRLRSMLFRSMILNVDYYLDGIAVKKKLFFGDFLPSHWLNMKLFLLKHFLLQSQQKDELEEKSLFDKWINFHLSVVTQKEKIKFSTRVNKVNQFWNETAQ